MEKKNKYFILQQDVNIGDFDTELNSGRILKKIQNGVFLIANSISDAIEGNFRPLDEFENHLVDGLLKGFRFEKIITEV